MNVLDRLDQQVREGQPPKDWVWVPRAHLRALLDVARAAHAHIDMEWAAFVEYGELSVTHSKLDAALAPLLEEQ